MPFFGSSDKEEMQRRAGLLNPSTQAGDLGEIQGRMQGRCRGDAATRPSPSTQAPAPSRSTSAAPSRAR